MTGPRPTQALPRGPPTDRAGCSVGPDRRAGDGAGDHAFGRRRPGPEPSGNRRAGPGPSATGEPAGTNGYQEWPLGRLAETRAGPGRPLAASAPPDVGPEQRRLDDERAWLQARGRRSEPDRRTSPDAGRGSRGPTAVARPARRRVERMGTPRRGHDPSRRPPHRGHRSPAVENRGKPSSGRCRSMSVSEAGMAPSRTDDRVLPGPVGPSPTIPVQWRPA